MPLSDVDRCFEGSRDGPVNRKKTNESPEQKCSINQNPNHDKIHSPGSFSQYSTQQQGYLCVETSGSCDFPHSFFHKLQKCGYENNNDDQIDDRDHRPITDIRAVSILPKNET